MQTTYTIRIHTIIHVMRYLAFLEITKGFNRKNSSSRPCSEVEIGFSTGVDVPFV